MSVSYLSYKDAAQSALQKKSLQAATLQPNNTWILPMIKKIWHISRAGISECLELSAETNHNLDPVDCFYGSFRVGLSHNAK